MRLPRRLYTVGWIVIGVALAALEALALWDKGRRDTLTEHLRPLLRRYPILWLGGLGLAVWVIGHLWFGLP